MNKLLGVLVLGLLLSGCSSAMTTEEFAKTIEELNKKKNEKELICKKEVKNLSGSEAVDKYEECLKRK